MLGRFVGQHCPQHHPQGVQLLICPCMLQYWQQWQWHCCGFCGLSICIVFLWGLLMTSYSINSLRCLPITFSTICQSLPQFHLSSVMNSIDIFPLTQRTSRMAFHGGTRDMWPSLACLIWIGTISQFLVSNSTFYICLFTWHMLITNFLATSIDVEQVFSQGLLLLSHVCSCLSIQSMHALLCLGKWSTLDLVKDSDVRACLTVDEVGEDEEVLVKDWDAIAIWVFLFELQTSDLIFYPTYHLNISAYCIVCTNVNMDSFCHIPMHPHASCVPSHHTIPTLTHQTCTPHVTHVQPMWPLPTHTCTCTNLYPCPQVGAGTGMGWPSVTQRLPTVITLSKKESQCKVKVKSCEVKV